MNRQKTQWNAFHASTGIWPTTRLASDGLNIHGDPELRKQTHAGGAPSCPVGTLDGPGIAHLCCLDAVVSSRCRNRGARAAS